MRIFIILFFIVFLNAEEIKQFNVYVNISKEGKLRVTEKILYDFKPHNRHGIFRNIPLNQNRINLIDVKMDNNYVNYETFYQNGDFVVKIGSKDRVINGTHLYTLTYSLDNVVFKKDKTHNAISLNAVGTGWNVNLKNIKVVIHLPAVLQNAKIEAFTGTKGSTNQIKLTKINNLTYEIDKKFLAPHEGITFDVVFDKNLIKIKKLQNGWVYLFLVIFSIGLYFYYTKHKIPDFSVSPQYYPPKFDVLKTGVLIDQSADEKDFSAAILELATKGYLKIEDSKEDKRFVLTKLKEGKDLDYDLQKLFYTLFSHLDKFILGTKDKRVSGRLKNAVLSINEWLYKWGVKSGYFFENPKKAKKIFFLKAFLAAFPFIGYAFFKTASFYQGDMFFLIIFSLFMIVGLIMIKTVSKIMGVLFFLFSLLMLWGFNISLLNPFTLSLISILIIAYFSNKIGVYTQKGIASLKYILGFKEFVNRVEKDKIEVFLKENPNYLDEILPYAVLFGAKHWLNFYKEFNVTPKGYYGNRTVYLGDDLYYSFKESSNYIENSSSGFDSFSGGGSVGSGSGGGGGGSW